MVFNYMLTITFQKEQLQKDKSSEKKFLSRGVTNTNISVF